MDEFFPRGSKTEPIRTEEKATCTMCGRELYTVHILPDGRCKRCAQWTTDPLGKYSPEEMWEDLVRQGQAWGPNAQAPQAPQPQAQPERQATPRKKTLRVQAYAGTLSVELSTWEKNGHRRIYINRAGDRYSYGYFAFSSTGELLQEVQSSGRRSWKDFLPALREEAIQMARAIWGKEV